jgi:hypothetical protein
MRGWSWVLVGVGAIALAVGVVIGLAPLRSNGVRGSAVFPRYSHVVGYGSYVPLPAHATESDLRRANVRTPQDAVDARRHRAELVSGSGAALMVAGGGALVFEGRRPRGVARRRYRTVT